MNTWGISGPGVPGPLRDGAGRGHCLGAVDSAAAGNESQPDAAGSTSTRSPCSTAASGWRRWSRSSTSTRQGALELGDRLLRELGRRATSTSTALSARRPRAAGREHGGHRPGAHRPAAPTRSRPRSTEAARQAEPRCRRRGGRRWPPRRPRLRRAPGRARGPGPARTGPTDRRPHPSPVAVVRAPARGRDRPGRGRPQPGTPGLFLVVLLAVTGGGRCASSPGGGWSGRRRADRLLARPAPGQAELPARTMAGGDASLGMALAVAGTGVLWRSDPALALAVGPAEGASGRHRWWGGGGDGERGRRVRRGGYGCGRVGAAAAAVAAAVAGCGGGGGAADDRRLGLGLGMGWRDAAGGARPPADRPRLRGGRGRGLPGRPAAPAAPGGAPPAGRAGRPPRRAPVTGQARARPTRPGWRPSPGWPSGWTPPW